MSFGSKPPAMPYYPPPPPPITPDAIVSQADQAAEQVKANARKMTGRAATILTSPLGVTTPTPVTPKSLLGS
jgi:hypothetical protein